ncbi:MAG: rhomboid family intramembrane serine protease [Gemmatimonadota bacterium]
MFPYRDDNPTLRTPVVTMLLILLNGLSWVIVQGMGTEPSLSASVCELGLIPGELLRAVPYGYRLPMGNGMVCLLTQEAGWYTPLTSMFLHGGWFHLIGNMWFLWLFGNNVEDSMGRVRFLVFYLLCGLAAAAVQVLSNPASPLPMVGASGAIGGVMGAYVVLYPRVRVHLLVVLIFFVTTIRMPAWAMLGYWFLLQVLGGLPSLAGVGPEGGTAFWAHTGGFLAGALLVRVFQNPALVEAHRAWIRRHYAYAES